MVHSDYRRGGNLQRETDGCVVTSAASVAAGLRSAAEEDSWILSAPSCKCEALTHFLCSRRPPDDVLNVLIRCDLLHVFMVRVRRRFTGLTRILCSP